MITGLLIGGMAIGLIVFMILWAAISNTNDHLEHLSHEFHFLTSKINTIMADLTGLQAAQTDVIAIAKSLEALADKLLAALQATGSDQTVIDQMTSDANALKQEIADTITRDTPAA